MGRVMAQEEINLIQEEERKYSGSSDAGRTRSHLSRYRRNNKIT